MPKGRQSNEIPQVSQIMEKKLKSQKTCKIYGSVGPVHIDRSISSAFPQISTKMDAKLLKFSQFSPAVAARQGNSCVRRLFLIQPGSLLV